ncbi:tyrosine-type recombinase/integrase [Pedobacter ginsenosidimutans]|uniref:tyrosine-type recombinase/integrase n=1 Tax=Pedobacter ginsenosidimutans TaxID=687842 RepID=UPI0009F9B95E
MSSFKSQNIARHTFATMVTLLNGVSIERVSKMLGHTNIRTTQHYAKILETKVSEDLVILQKKLRKLNLSYNNSFS